jgi:hypothetical protein
MENYYLDTKGVMWNTSDVEQGYVWKDTYRKVLVPTLFRDGLAEIEFEYFPTCPVMCTRKEEDDYVF